VQGDAQLLPYESASFDVVYSFKVLAHLTDPGQALAEIRRVLRPDGVAVLEFYNRHSIRFLLRRSGYFHRWLSPTQVRRLLAGASLSIVQTYGARIVTPAACVLDLPTVGRLIRSLERSLSSTALSAFAGYLITVCRSR
jgi:ubiquinone/menaquinone biosynthesis C-methylase UbiE